MRRCSNYEAESQGLGLAFLSEVERSVAALVEPTEASPQKETEHGMRPSARVIEHAAMPDVAEPPWWPIWASLVRPTSTHLVPNRETR